MALLSTRLLALCVCVLEALRVLHLGLVVRRAREVLAAVLLLGVLAHLRVVLIEVLWLHVVRAVWLLLVGRLGAVGLAAAVGLAVIVL